MTTILSKVPAIRKFYATLPEIPENILYKSDYSLTESFEQIYDVWKKEEDSNSIYISKKGETSISAKLGTLEEITRSPFSSKTLTETARKTLVNIHFEETMKNYEELLASTKSEKKKKALIKPTFEEALRFVIRLTDYEVFQTLEFNDYFVFEQLEGITGSNTEGQQILLKVNKNEID